jgi:nucleoside-diphosphate-sugar epimerase
MRILITGGAGFLGQHAAHRAIRAGHRVVLYDRAAAAATGAETIIGDIADRGALVGAMRDHGIDAAVHLATLLTDASVADPVEGTRINCVGTAALFEAARIAGVERVVYASSQAALGMTVQTPGDDAPLRPATVYGATKAFGEHLARAYGDLAPDLTLIGLRFGWVYGPFRDRGWREVQQVIEGFARGRGIVRWPDAAEPIDWTYADDAADAILAALTAPQPSTPVFNVCGDRRRIAEAVAYLSQRFPEIRAVSYPARFPISAWDFRADGLARELGFAPAVKMEDGIDRLIAWLATNAGVDGASARR